MNKERFGKNKRKFDQKKQEKFKLNVNIYQIQETKVDSKRIF